MPNALLVRERTNLPKLSSIASLEMLHVINRHSE
jgi:hypothetical protein